MKAYHGTPYPDSVEREGILTARSSCQHSPGCVWIARSPEDAAVFGTVFEIDMSGIEGEFTDWQAHLERDIEPWRLRRYEKAEA